MKALPPAMSKQGVGLSKFIANPSALTKAMDLPASKQTVDVSATDVTPKPVVAPKALPAANLVPDPIAAYGQDTDGSTIYDKKERIRRFKEERAKRAAGFVAPPKEAGDIPKVDKLEDAGIGEKDVKEKVKKDLEDNLEIDPKMKKAFMDALALPAKSAAVAMTDLLEKIPAPSKEASKILNRNISKISNSFKLGAASAEVANDEADNDKKDDKKGGSVIGGLLAKAINFVRGKMGGGDSASGGDQPQLPSAPQQNLLPSASGDPTFGRRAPYTGTADGIGMGDGSGRAMEPVKKTRSMASKLFGLTPMGMAFNAGKGLLKGAKGLAGKMGKDGLGGIAKKAFAINLDSSELQRSVVKTLLLSNQFAYILTNESIASLLSPPIKTLSGLFRSFIAVPSAINSGLERTANLFFTSNEINFLGFGISSKSEITIKSFSFEFFNPLIIEFL